MVGKAFKNPSKPQLKVGRNRGSVRVTALKASPQLLVLAGDISVKKKKSQNNCFAETLNSAFYI